MDLIRESASHVRSNIAAWLSAASGLKQPDLEDIAAICRLTVSVVLSIHRRGDTRNELYAKFGRLHRDVESGSYAAVLGQVEADLKNPVLENEPALKIRALALKGAIELNVDTAGAKSDFAQILAIARSSGDQKWENRAAGELGIIAGVNGDLGHAAVALQTAIAKAGALHDIGGQVYFTTWLANGMSVHGMADRALPLIDRALDTVKANPEAGLHLRSLRHHR